MALSPIPQNHRLDVEGGKLTLDGRIVNVTIRVESGEMQIGCTRITKAAIQKIWRMSCASPEQEIVLQEAERIGSPK